MKFILSGKIKPVVVVGPEGCVAFWTFPLTCLIASAETIPAEDVKALGQHGILSFHLKIIIQINTFVY